MSRLILCLFCLILAACTPKITNVQPTGFIHPGDTLSIAIEGEPDLSGTYTINEIGEAVLPLIGTVNLQNLSNTEAIKKIENAYAQGYLINPKARISKTDSKLCPCPQEKTR
jgi:polysaccharide export outer membrane protein